MATKLNLAEAQFIGWMQAKDNPSIINLVKSMGLSKSEWQKIKSDPINKSIVSKHEWEEIDEYFKPSNKTPRGD